jgi:hypothetical protein
MQSGAYAFIYDDVLNDRRYERELAEVEARLTSLDIQGRVGRLTLFRSAKDLIESMVYQGVSTVVIVGNDNALDKTIWFLPDLNVTIGYIPIAGPSRIAELLGIPSGIGACDVLAARLTETVDVGKIDGRYFLTEVSLPSTMAAVEIEGRYRISAAQGGAIAIRNLGSLAPGQPLADAKDGLLEVVVNPYEGKQAGRKPPQGPGQSSMMMRYGEIFSQDPVEVMVDNHVVNGFKFHVGIVPNKLRIITGRARRLSSIPTIAAREADQRVQRLEANVLSRI